MLKLLFFGPGCYYVEVPMKSAMTIISRCCRRFSVNLLLVGLLLSSTSSIAKVERRQSAERSGPTRIHQAKTVLRDHALTSSAGPQVAGDLSQQKRGKHSLNYIGLAPAKVSALTAFVRLRPRTTDRSFWYLSLRLSRPRGRAPPASA